MSVGTIYVPECAPVLDDLAGVSATPLSPVSGRVRVKSRREQLCDAIAGCIEDLEADIAEGRMLRVPSVAARLRLLRSELAELDARGFVASYVDAIGVEA